MQYDQNGNIAHSANGSTASFYKYDAESRLISRTVGAGNASYTYDGNGALVKRTNADGTYTEYIGGIFEKSFDATGTPTGTTKYYSALGRTIAVRQTPLPAGGAGTVTYLLADHLGTTVGAIDAATGAVTTAKYWPYGAPRSGAITQTDKLYTGQQQEQGDALGLYYYHARFYSTTLGRFVSADPVNGGLNRYAYTYNNPVNSADPTGLAPESPLAEIAGAVTWWSTYFEVDPAIVLALFIWEGDKSGLQTLYETGGYFALSIGGEAGLRRYEREPIAILGALAGNAFGPFGAIAGAVAGHFLSRANEVSWGPANITLTLAKALEKGNSVLAKSSAKETVDALRSTVGAIAYLAAAVKSYAANVPAGVTGDLRTAHIVVQHSVGRDAYNEYVKEGAFPVQDASGRWGITGARSSSGDLIGPEGASYLNNVMPIVDVARAITTLCAAGRSPC